MAGRERGAALVEAALIFPVLAMLVYGMLTGGMALSQRSSLQGAAREASRFGATSEVTSGTSSWLTQVATVAVDAATGDLDAVDPGRYVCVALAGGGVSPGRRVVQGGSATNGTGNCPGMSCPTAAPCVQVLLRREAELDAIFVHRTFTVEAKGTSVFERA